MEKRLTQDELAQRLAAAAQLVAVGAEYLHYKNMRYKVLRLAIMEATNEICVIYQAQYDERLVFVRPVQSWTETVELDGKRVARFAKIAG